MMPRKCQHIRTLINDSFDSEVAELIPLLYGGSCKPECVKTFSQQDIDGGLIGGASLNADSFMKIIKSF